jgi:hypothetical protein
MPVEWAGFRGYDGNCRNGNVFLRPSRPRLFGRSLAMRKAARSSPARKSRKKYASPKLTTHGSVAKLTQGHAYGHNHNKHSILPDSGIF